ncbi:MAG TPA: hypothetical protein VFT98_16955 [Myxococcota bacterium]|nr:hypothetical protein [Myxococcota bacterium]
MRDPRVQSGYMKDVAEALARLGAQGAAVRAADEALFLELASAPRGAWLPIALNVRWVEAAARAFGWPAALDFLAARVADQFGSPLFRSLVDGGVRLFGPHPGALMRVIPRGLAIVFRDCGEWTAVRTSQTSLELRAVSLPAEVAGHARWVESIGAGAIAMLALCRTAGRVQLAEHDRSAGRAVIDVRWGAQ